MFEKIFIEEHLKDHLQVNYILNAYPQSEITWIKDIEEVFNRVKKPYLQKRKSLHLFLGEKRGNLVKPAPPAYGLSGEPHYYFVHAYNCIYECNYCYLQGYFHSPDIVLFLNHEEIGQEITRLAQTNLPTKSWFHAGEYSDSLALTSLTHEIPFYFNLFKSLPHAYLELRTKSVNIKEILKELPLENIITSFSLSPKERAKKSDLKTPSTQARLDAIGTLHENNFLIAIHFDPIIYEDNFISTYCDLIDNLIQKVPPEFVRYISLGVVRFTKDVYHQVQKNYPTSDLLAQEFVKSFDNKIRYSRPMRMWMLLKIKDLLMQKGFTEKQIYLCMEETDA